MINLSGKTALITGGSRGIGRESALLFAKSGCDVVISYVNRLEKAKEVQAEVERIGKRCLIQECDVGCEEDVKTMVKNTIDQMGRIDILINNAGIWTFGEMGNMEKAVWAETIRINLDSNYFVCNSVVPFMKENKSGNIIFVSSTAAVRGEAFHSHYAASKGALNSLTKSLAVELAPFGIRVNCVTPGWTETDMCTDIFRDKEYKKKVEDSIPLKRVAAPVDIAGPILFLASDLARHITGEILNINGGSVLCG